MATVTIANNTFEAGASILHPKNYHALNFTKFLQLKKRVSENDDCESLGIWDGKKLVFRTWSSNWGFSFVNKVVSLLNSIKLFWRYGFSLLKMQNVAEVPN